MYVGIGWPIRRRENITLYFVYLQQVTTDGVVPFDLILRVFMNFV